MADYIKSSIEIDAWLKAQGITVEPDEFAPKVFEGRKKQTITGIVEDPGKLYVCSEARIPTHEYVCPYYGPGGEGNSLEALSKLGFVTLDNHYGTGLTNDLPYQTWWTAKLHKWNKCKDGLGRFECGVKAKTRSGALRDLLYKLKEAK